MKRFFMFLLWLVLHCECSGLRTVSCVCAVISDTLGIGQVVHETIGVCKSNLSLARRHRDIAEPFCYYRRDFWDDCMGKICNFVSPDWCCIYRPSNCGLLPKVAMALLQPCFSVFGLALSPFLSEKDSYIASIGYSALGILLAIGYTVTCHPCFEVRRVSNKDENSNGN